MNARAPRPELVCPAGSLAALRAAVDHGADAVYVGFRDRTNARAFPGLNFTDADLARGIDYAHDRGRRVFVALNTYPGSDELRVWERAVDRAADLGADAVIAADPAVLDYVSRTRPDLPRHLSVQASAVTAEALGFYARRWGVTRAVLPRVLTLAQVERLARSAPVGLEVFACGSLCIMVEGRCQLSAYVTGASPNTSGVCSPAHCVRWEEGPDGRSARLGDVLVDRYAPGEVAGYPTVCKGRYAVDGRVFHVFEEPTSLDVLPLLPRLAACGVAALKIEGRQRGPAYVARVTRVWREALDSLLRDPASYRVEARWERELASLAEGARTTLGPYDPAGR